MKIIYVLMLLLLSIPCHAFDKWDKENVFLQTAATTLTIVDWGQTRYIAKSDEYYESNPILGKYPTVGEVDRYFSVCILAGLTLTHILPNPYRKYFQYFHIGLESGYAFHNYNIGVKINF